jgi:hypothetical protein
MNNKNFEKKYDFDLSKEIKKSETENSQKNQIKNEEMKVIENTKTITQNPPLDSYKIEIVLDNPDDIKKIKIDSKTYYENLRRKIILNSKLLSTFIDNFYRDEFNNTRKSSYLIFALPCSVLMFFKMVSPHHPLLGTSFTISVLASIISFGYYFNEEMSYVSRMPYSDIGAKIRNIKNELVLYNPLCKPIEIEEESKSNNRKI